MEDNLIEFKYHPIPIEKNKGIWIDFTCNECGRKLSSEEVGFRPQQSRHPLVLFLEHTHVCHEPYTGYTNENN